MAEEDSDPRLAKERVDAVLELVRKKANAAIGGRVKGNHFSVYPPQEYLDRPEVLQEEGIHEKLKDTVWWVKWYDGQYNPLPFLEFMVFIHQILQAEEAFKAAVEASKHRPDVPKHRPSKHAGGWTEKKDRSRRPKPTKQVYRVEGLGFKVDELQQDEMIRALFNAVTVEPIVRPPEAMN